MRFMARNVILDNDLFVILAGAHLLEPWLESFRISRDRVYVLPSLPRMLERRKGALCRSHCEAVLKSAEEQVKNYKMLPVANNDILDYFAGIPNVDIGEQQIFAQLVTDEFLFAGTNDKKSIRAVCSKPEIAEMLGKKIVCMEQCLCALIRCRGWKMVNDAIVQLKEKEEAVGQRVDNRLNCIFSQRVSGENQIKDALNSFMTPLVAECGNVLFPEWLSLQE